MMTNLPLALALLLQSPFPTGLVHPTDDPSHRPLEIDGPPPAETFTKADTSRLADRIDALSARLDEIAAHTQSCVCSPSVVGPKPKASTSATIYQLKDARGQVWTHPDPAWLKTYVGLVNASAASRPRQNGPMASPFPSPCAGGQCPR